jgi:molybdenum cofactor cytidylyltransferase
VIAGLVLAAGAGSRFGEAPKQLAELNGRPLLEHAVAAQCAVAELERIVVVLGAHADQILAAVDFGRSEPVLCPEWISGQSASLRCGAAALAGAERVIVTLGDVPTVTPALIRRFLDTPPGARATFGGTPGHPVVLGADHLALLGQVTGDRGARDLLAGGVLIECGDLGAGEDIDTAADLERVRNPGPA